MADLYSTSPPGALDERWLAAALDELPPRDAPRQLLLSNDGRITCLNAVGARDPAKEWLWYSAAAAKRASVTDDRLLPLIACGNYEGRFYVAYALGSAMPLSTYREVEELTTDTALGLLRGLARALDSAGRRKLYPSEVTPECVFVDPRRGTLLGDLGVAREALGNPQTADDPGAPWVAPEVLRGEEAGARSAVYAYGALAYTLLSGRPPHSGTAEEIAQADPPSLSEVRSDLAEPLDLVIATAMSPDPRKRYQSASEATRLTHLLLQQSTGLAPPTEETARRRFHLARHDPAQEHADELEYEAQRREIERREKQKRAAFEAQREQEGQAQRKRAELEAQRERKRQAKRRRGEDKQARRVSARRAKEERATERGAARSRATPTRSGVLALLLVAGAVALGAAAGALFGSGGGGEPAAPTRVAAAGLALTAPSGWVGSAPNPGSVEAHPAGDRASGLTVKTLDTPIEAAEQATAVRLGKLEAWRDTGAPVAGGQSAVRYVVPTASGKLVATCRASSRAASGTLALCERSASTLRLKSAASLPLADVLEQQRLWRRATSTLSRERSAARRSLARADRPAGQRLAAEALRRVHERAGKRFAALPGGEDVAAASRRTAAAYGALAAATGRTSSRAWDRARARVRRSESGLAAALDAAL